MPTFLMALIRGGLKSLLAAALAQSLVDYDKDPSTALSDEEIAKLTPQQYGETMAEDLLQRMGFPAA